MSLIKNLPVISYGDYNLKDISKRVAIARVIKDDPTVYQMYSIEGTETAEDIAQDFYGDPTLYWLVYLMNDIIDPFYGWVLSDEELGLFISDKYPSAELDTHHTNFDDISVYLNDNPIVTGDHYWALGEPVKVKYKFIGFDYSYARLSTEIDIVSGDSIQLSYDSLYSGPSGNAHEYFIKESSGAANPAHCRSFFNGTEHVFDLVGFTGTINGDPIIPGTTIVPYRINSAPDRLRNAPITIVLTATTSSDIYHFAQDGTGVDGTSGNAGAEIFNSVIYDIIIIANNVTYKWLDFTYDQASHLDENGSGISYIINDHVTSRWQRWDWAIDAGSSANDIRYTGLSPRISSTNAIVNGTSLRYDGLGRPITIQPPYHGEWKSQILGFGSNIITTGFDYGNGFTVECLVKPLKFTDNLSATTGKYIHFLTGYGLDGRVIWAMGFNNFHDLTDTAVPVPFFTLVERGQTVYTTNTNHGDFGVADVRGTAPLILGETYHMAASIRPSSNTIELWVNGISQGTAPISDPATFFSPNGAGNADDLLSGLAPHTLHIAGAPSGSAQCVMQDVRVHLSEPTTSFIEGQSLAAATSSSTSSSFSPGEVVTNTKFEETVNDKKRQVKIIRPASLRDIKTLIRASARENS